MIRTVLAVVLATVLLAVATPAIDDGRTARTATHLNRVVDRIERAVRSLYAHEDPTRPPVAGARRIVAFRLPTSSWTATGATLRIDGPGDRIGYRIDGRPPRWVSLRGVDLRTPTGPVALEAPGRHRLVLSFVREGGGRAVVARRS